MVVNQCVDDSVVLATTMMFLEQLTFYLLKIYRSLSCVLEFDVMFLYANRFECLFT